MSETFDPFAALGAQAAPAGAPEAPAAPAAADGPFDPFAALGAAPQPAAADPNAGKKTGYLANLAAGAVEGASGALNFLSDPIGHTGSMLGTLGVAAYDAITRQFGGEGIDPKLRQALFGDDGTGPGTKLAETVRLATGAPKLEDVRPATPGEGLARGAAAGAAGMGPFATGGVGRVAGSLAAGAAGGVVGKGLADSVPERYQDAANLIGNFAGMIGAHALGTAASEAGRGAARTFRDARQPFAGRDEPFIDPRTGEPFRNTQTDEPVRATAGQADLAAQRLQEAGGRPGTEVAATIPDRAQQQIVPGSQPTVGQATGNVGLLRLERDQRTRNPDVFGQAEAANQVARVNALRSMADPEATGAAAGEFAADHLRAIREHEANLDRLAEAYAQQAAQRVGPGPGQTSERTIGTAQQEALEALRGPIKAARSALYDAVDPSGTKLVNVASVGETARRLQGELNTETTGLAPGIEGPIMDALARWRGEITFADLRRADTALGDAMRKMMKAGEAETSPYRRATILREAIDQALHAEVARAAAADVTAGAAGGAAGNLSTVGQRLAALQERVLQGDNAGAGAGGPGGAGPVAAGPGSGAPSGAPGGAGQGNAGPGGATPSGGVATGPTDVGPRFSRTGERAIGNVVPLYSAAARAVDRLPQAKGTGEQMLAQITKAPGVKPEELKWLGLPEWLRGQKSVTKDQIAEYVRANALEVREVRRGRNEELPSRFDSYILPGGKNYREMLFTLPGVQGENGFRSSHWPERNVVAHVRFQDHTAPDGKKVLTVEEVQSDWHQQGRRDGYRDPAAAAELKRVSTELDSATADLENAYSDLRAIDRDLYAFRRSPPSPEGKRASEEMAALHAKLEELPAGADTHAARQAYEAAHAAYYTRLNRGDFGDIQALKDKEAAANAAADSARERRNVLYEEKERLSRQVYHGVPDAPFKTTWPALVMKRMLAYAAEHGYDRIAWPPGSVHADRFDLSRQIQSLDYDRNPDGTYSLAAQQGGERHVIGDAIPEAKLEDYVGKEVAKRIVDGAGTDQKYPSGEPYKRLSGIDLKVGGEGMKGFYDKILPAEANKIVGKFGGKVGKSEIALPDRRADWSGEESYVLVRHLESAAELAESEGRTALAEDLRRRADDLDNVGVTPADVMRGISPAAMAYMPESIRERMLGARRQDVHSIDITPAMRDAITEQGLPLFQRGENALVPTPEAVMAAIDVANRMTGGKALVQAHDPDSGVFTVRFADGSTERVNGYAIGSLIQVAMDPKMLETVGHEAVHVVRNLGLITPAEWRKLSDMVLRDDLIGKYRLEENYPGLRGDDLIEEAVAEHAAQTLRAAEGKKPAGLIGRFIDAIRRFGARVRSALTGMGWRSPEDVFADLTGGKMGEREVGAGAPTRGPVGARASQEAATRWARDTGQPAEPAAPRYSNEPRFSRTGTPEHAGIPGTDLPPATGEPFTAADRAALRQANAAYREYKQAYRDGVVGQVLQRGNTPTGFNVPPEAVPALLFRPGTQGATAMAALLRATTLARDGDAVAGAMLARQILGDAPAFSFRRAAERNGVIVPALAEKWLADHRPLLDLDTVTGLRDQFATAADATRTLEEVRARGEANIEAAQRSALRHLLTKDGQSVEPQVAITNLLRSPRAIEDAKALMKQLAPSQAAVDGLRSELVDHLIRQTESAAEAGTTGVSEIKGASFQRLANDPRTAGVIRTILGPTGAELVRRIADDIQRFGRSVNVTKVPGSPGTAMDYFAALKGDGKPYASIIGQLAVAQAVGYLGMAAAGGSGLHGVAGGTLLATAKIVYDAMRRRGFERVDDLVNQAIVQPELARVLLSREPLEPGTPAMKRFLRALSGVVPATSASHYADEQRRSRAGGAAAPARAH